MLTLEQIQGFLNERDFDIRKTGNGRWIDQKCTPDVIWSIADFILDYVDNVEEKFSVTDIWQSDYAKETIAETYSKPGTNEKAARNEYDKVFSQPLNLFCYAGIIKDISTNNRHLYVLENRDVLEYIARNDVYALRFLACYIEKVLIDSGMFQSFEVFFNQQNRASFEKLKNEFISFYHKYTPIKKDFEPKRIFTKVLNPLAFKYRKRGTIRGRLSENLITKSDMMYNRDNFRDVYRNKPKDISRKEWLMKNPEIDIREGYFKQMMSRSMKTLRQFNGESRNGLSELTQFINGHDDQAPATQLHHMFPKSQFPEIMHYSENIIALTPNQHYGFAHPKNNTHVIDVDAQKVLLIAKTYSIQKNIMDENEEPIYDFYNLLKVLSVGWNDESVLEISENDYMAVLHSINYHYDDIHCV